MRSKNRLKGNLLNINMKKNWYFKPRMPVWEVGFVHHGRVTSYNLRRHFYIRIVKVDFLCLILIAQLYSFFFFNNTETTNNHHHKGMHIITFFVDTGRNSHAIHTITNQYHLLWPVDEYARFEIINGRMYFVI